MISVENLYWILYETLLRPTNFQARYFYPFGTTQYLSRDEFHPFFNPRHHAHVLFHFDQEPLYEDADKIIFSTHDGSRTKAPMILANSEHSQFKKFICKDTDMLDWYFFYHGFAALDWYRDARFIDSDQPIKYHFCSLNHLVKDLRCYRMALSAKLAQKNLVHNAVFSFHGSVTDCREEILNPNTRLTIQEKISVSQWLQTVDTLPVIADLVEIDGSVSARFGVHDLRLRQQCFLQLVNETVFYHDKLHLTEKVFQAIVTKRPFILVGAPGNLSYIKSYGFKTFDAWIDETYDLETDPVRRLDMIVNQIEKLCQLNVSQLQKILADMQEVLEHNKQHFFGNFRHIIVNELVDNFDQCIRLWNNGRIDRVQPSHPDLVLAKQVLLR